MMMSALDTARKVQDKLAQLQKTFECPICLELMKNPVSTKCDHKFCRHCLLSTIGKKTSAPCPLCKENFTKRSLQSLPKWNELVTTIEKLVLAYQQDTGEQFSPPKGPPLPVSQSSQQAKANRSKRAKCRRRTNFDEADRLSQQTASIPGQKRKAEEEVIIYIEDADDLGGDKKPHSVLKSNTNISPSFCLGAPSKKRKSSERKQLQMGGEENQTLLPSHASISRNEDVVAYLTSASFTQKSPDLSLVKNTGDDGKKLTIAVPRSMTKDLGCDGSTQSHQTKPRSRNTRRAKRKEFKPDSEIQINLLSEVGTINDEVIDLTPEETIAERIKRNGIKRGTASKLATEPALSKPGKENRKGKIQSMSDIDSEEDSKPVGNLRSKLKKICSTTLESRATKASKRKADVVNYLITAPTAGLCGMSQGKVEPETRILKKEREGEGTESKVEVSHPKEEHPECQPGTKTKVEKWLAAAPDSVSPLMSENSKTLTMVAEGVDCDSIPSQAVGHELELCLEQMADAEMIKDKAAEAAGEEVYPEDDDDDDDDAGLIVRTDDDDDNDPGNEDIDENSCQDECYDSTPANTRTANSDHVFGPITEEDDTTETEDDTSQEDQNSVAGSTTRRIFKTRNSIQLQSPQKAKYKVIGTPNSDDPYAFKPSQKTPKSKPKKGRRARAKQRKKKQLQMQDGANAVLTKEAAMENKNKKPNEKQSKMKKKRKQLQQQEEESERTSQQIDAMAQKISEAEDFELMMSQQYREMVASAKKKKQQERQEKAQSVKSANVDAANETPAHNSTNSVSSSDLPIPGTALSEGRKLQSALSRGKSSVIRKRVTISCVTQECRQVAGLDANRRHSAAATTSDKKNRRPLSKAAVAKENVSEDSGRETPFRTLNQELNSPVTIQETPLIGQTLKVHCESQDQPQMESVAVTVDDDTAGESPHKVPVPKIDAKEAWKSARKMSHELGPKTKKLQMVQSQKPHKRSSLSTDKRKKAVEPPPVYDTSTEDDVTIQEVMSEVRGHEEVTSPGDAQNVPQRDSSDTESLDSSHSSPHQFEPANLDIQPESVKKKLLESLQGSEGQSPQHSNRDHSFQQITVEVVPESELKELLTPKNKKCNKKKLPANADEDKDESWQEPSCAIGSERGKKLDKSQKRKNKDNRDKVSSLSTPEKSSAQGFQAEKQTSSASQAHDTSKGQENPGSLLSSGRSGQGSGRRTFSLTLSPNGRLPRPEPESLEMRNAIEEALELMEKGNGAAIDPANKELYESVLWSAKKRSKRNKRAARKSVPMNSLETEEQKNTESNGEEDLQVITDKHDKESNQARPINQAPCLIDSDGITGTDRKSADLLSEDTQTGTEESTIISVTTGASDTKVSPIIPVPNLLEMPCRKRISAKSEPSREDTSSRSSYLETKSDKKGARKGKKQKHLDEKCLQKEAEESQEGDSAPIPDTGKASKKKLSKKAKSNRTSSLDSKRSLEKSQTMMPMASLESECSVSLLCPNPETVTSQSGKKTLKRPRRENSTSEEDEEECTKPEQKRLSGKNSQKKTNSTNNTPEISGSGKKKASQKSRKSYVSSDTEADTISDYQEVEEARRVGPPCDSLEPSDFVPPTPQADKLDTSLPKKKISPQAPTPNSSKPHRLATSPANVTAKLISEDVDDETNFLNLASPHSSTTKFKKKLIRPRIASCEPGIGSEKTSSQSQHSVSLLQPIIHTEKPSGQFEHHSQDGSLQINRDTGSERKYSSTKKRRRHEDQISLSSDRSHGDRMTLAVPKDATPLRKKLPLKPAPTTPSQPINLAVDDDDDDVLDEEQIVTNILCSKWKSHTPVVTMDSDVDDISLSPDVTALEEPEASEEEEHIGFTSRSKKRKKPVIEDDSDESDIEDTTACQTINMTSSSAFSTQSELLSTQAKQDLQQDVKSIENEIAQLEAKLAAKKPSPQLPRGDDSVESYDTAPSQSPRGNARSQQDNRNQVTDAGEESDEDLFATPEQEVSASPQPSMHVSVASPSPPPSGLPSVLTSPSKQPPELQEAARVLEELRSKTASQLSEDSWESAAGSQSNKIKTKLDEAVDDFENYSVKKHSAAKLKHRKVAVLRDSPAVNVKQDSIKVSPRSTSSSSFKRSSNSSLLSGGKIPARSDWVFVTSGISKLLQKPYVEKLCKLLGCKMVSQYSTAVTHVLVKPSEEGSLKCSRTLKYFQGIAGQKFVLSVQWAIDCIKEKTLLDETPYEIIEDTVEEGHYGPRKSRESTCPLLSAYEICCYGDFADLSAEDLRDLVQSCGGKVASNPETFRSKKRPLKLIVVEGNHVDVMPELKKLHRYQGLPIITKEWLLDSVGAYEVKPLEEYILYG